MPTRLSRKKAAIWVAAQTLLPMAIRRTSLREALCKTIEKDSLTIIHDD